MLLKLLVLLSLSFFETESNNPFVDPLVLTSSGWVRGLQATDGDYTMFMGIPYAKVNPDNPFGFKDFHCCTKVSAMDFHNDHGFQWLPTTFTVGLWFSYATDHLISDLGYVSIKAERSGNAIPSPKFDGIFDAFDDTAICPQIEEYNNTIVGKLDCLHVNVYVPNSLNLDADVRLPVLLWVYGGLFQFGFAGRFVIGPKYLVRYNVILVTFNYRVGPYGFMCLDIPEVPGNQGLKDQQLAFSWVKENIASFGGNPERITVFGNSAGAMSIDLHLTFKNSTFRNAVIQSGSAVHPSLIKDSNPEVPLKIAEKIGLRPQNVYEALKILAMLPPATVIDSAFNIGVKYGPCVEKRFHGVDYFMTDYPVNIDRSKVNGMNIITGINVDEMLKFYALPAEHFYENWDKINENLNSQFIFEDEELRDKLVAVIRQFYIGDAGITEFVKWELCNYESDWFFDHPAERAINRYLKSGIQKVYYYMFAYDGQRNYIKRRNKIMEEGVAHSDELGYLFDMQLAVITEPPTPNDQLVLDRMTAMWTNFAKYDDPTPQLNSLLPVKWEPITNYFPRYYMNIDLNSTLGYNPMNIRMRFWDVFYEEYGKYEKGYRLR